MISNPKSWKRSLKLDLSNGFQTLFCSFYHRIQLQLLMIAILILDLMSGRPTESLKSNKITAMPVSFLCSLQLLSLLPKLQTWLASRATSFYILSYFRVKSIVHIAAFFFHREIQINGIIFCKYIICTIMPWNPRLKGPVDLW